MKLLPSPTVGIDWAEEARRRYSGQANITYPSRVAAQQVRDFILELAAAYERAVIMLEATQSALQSTRPEERRSEVAPPAGENKPGELEQVYKDLMDGTLVLVRNWFTKEPYCAQAEQKASQAICRAICAPSPLGTKP